MMPQRPDSSMRMGAISIFALVIVLCIAVMGMLAFTTGHAALASANKQYDYAKATYENEDAAWDLISRIDDALVSVKEDNWWWDKSDGIEAVSAIVNEENGVVDEQRTNGDDIYGTDPVYGEEPTQPENGSEVKREYDYGELLKEISMEDDEVTAKFQTGNGRTLDLKLTINDSLKLNIDEWNVSTDVGTDNGDMLWMGN